MDDLKRLSAKKEDLEEEVSDLRRERYNLEQDVIYIPLVMQRLIVCCSGVGPDSQEHGGEQPPEIWFLDGSAFQRNNHLPVFDARSGRPRSLCRCSAEMERLSVFCSARQISQCVSGVRGVFLRGFRSTR